MHGARAGFNFLSFFFLNGSGGWRGGGEVGGEVLERGGGGWRGGVGDGGVGDGGGLEGGIGGGGRMEGVD